MRVGRSEGDEEEEGAEKSPPRLMLLDDSHEKAQHQTQPPRTVGERAHRLKTPDHEEPIGQRANKYSQVASQPKQSPPTDKGEE